MPRLDVPEFAEIVTAAYELVGGSNSWIRLQPSERTECLYRVMRQLDEAVSSSVSQTSARLEDAEASNYSDGLTDQDCHNLFRFPHTILRTWNLLVEMDEDGNQFARVVAPWMSETNSAFWIERHGGLIVLTDRLSYDEFDLVSQHVDINGACRAIVQVFSGRQKANYLIRQKDVQGPDN